MSLLKKIRYLQGTLRREQEVANRPMAVQKNKEQLDRRAPSTKAPALAVAASAKALPDAGERWLP